MEILSPVGNFEALYASVRSGADAVYLGLKDFSARRNADNFSFDELRRATEYCRIRSVKVYVALNIMIKENEMSSAVNAAVSAYNCGVDAFIISDLGLISVLQNLLPEAVLHASTQMTVHSPASLIPLKKLGIKRVVLAREMSREEIKNFCIEAGKEDIEVEVFVHGALCMCVSGKCLLSSVLGGRSGNRGLCAGPCRLEFSASKPGRYDLSLKDLSLIDYLDELRQMGVVSAKIEGRMKRAEYVAAATAACRASMESAPDNKLLEALKNVFSRSGFTSGYYEGVLGTDMFGVRTKEDAEISKTAFSFLHSFYKAERQSIPVKIYARIKGNTPIKILFADNSGNSIAVEGAAPRSAQNRSTEKEDIILSLSKLGGTPYYVENADVEIENGLYISRAELNDLRRNAADTLSTLRAKNERNKSVRYTPARLENTRKSKPKIYTKFLNCRDLPESISCDGVILPLDNDFKNIPEDILKIAELPRFITDEKRILNRLSDIKKQGVYTAYCDNLESITLAHIAGFSVIASNGLNCANTESVKTIKSLGADMVSLSAETNMDNGRHIASAGGVGIFAYGRLPLMLTRNCPVKNTKTCTECAGKSFLTDRMGVKFPVRCKNGFSEILNSTPIYLADKADDLSAFDFLILSFTVEEKEKIQNIINAYSHSHKKSVSDYTRGLYYKSLL